MNGHVHLSAAVFRLDLDRPYLAAALWSLSRVPVEKLGTLAVDRFWRLYYDPVSIEAWTVAELSGVVYHELCHLLRDHASRRPPDADPKGWNIAADAEINDDLRGEEVCLPSGAIYPETIGQGKGLLAEQYYENLPRDPAGSAGLEDPRCGSCATGVPEVWEHGSQGDAPDAPPQISPGEADIVREIVAREIQEKGRGSVPGHWERWARERLTPRVDWRRELAATVRSCLAEKQGVSDYSYRRPSRRPSQDPRIVLPARIGPDPLVAVLVDTSGSMDDETQSMALAEIEGVLRACGRHHGVRIFAVDAAVHWKGTVFRSSQVRLLGGGGTDLRVGIEQALAEFPCPEILVAITDGYTPWPDKAPRSSRVVVLCTEPESDVPPWARCVRIPPAGEAD